MQYNGKDCHPNFWSQWKQYFKSDVVLKTLKCSIFWSNFDSILEFKDQKSNLSDRSHKSATLYRIIMIIMIVMRMKSYPIPNLPWWLRSRQQREPGRSRDTSSTWPPGLPGLGRPQHPWSVFWRTWAQLIDTITCNFKSRETFNQTFSQFYMSAQATRRQSYSTHILSSQGKILFTRSSERGKATVICFRPSALALLLQQSKLCSKINSQRTSWLSRSLTYENTFHSFINLRLMRV